MPKLVLHVGAPKTGTTFLQSVFAKNRKLLAEHGVHYPALGRTDGHHILTVPWLDKVSLKKMFLLPINAEAAWDKLLSEYLDVDGTVFVSSEMFSRSEPQPIDLAEVAQRLSAFDEVQVVCSLRDQASFSQSVWLEIAKKNKAPTVTRYLDAVLKEHNWSGVWFDYNLLYDHLLTGFRPDQITFVDYDKARATEGGILGSFLDILECPMDPKRLSLPDDDDANISSDALSFFVASQVASPDVPSKRLVKDVAEIILPDPAPRTIMLRRRQYREIQKHFVQLNVKLVQRVKPFQPDFDIEKPPFPDDCMFRENLTELHWIQIARLMYGQSASLRRRTFKPSPKIFNKILGK